MKASPAGEAAHPARVAAATAIDPPPVDRAAAIAVDRTAAVAVHGTPAVVPRRAIVAAVDVRPATAVGPAMEADSAAPAASAVSTPIRPFSIAPSPSQAPKAKAKSVTNPLLRIACTPA